MVWLTMPLTGLLASTTSPNCANRHGNNGVALPVAPVKKFPNTVAVRR
jgi:hypothetical protein